MSRCSLSDLRKDGVNLVADEGVELQVVERLREEGYAVLYIAEMDPGTPDDDVLDPATTRSPAHERQWEQLTRSAPVLLRTRAG